MPVGSTQWALQSSCVGKRLSLPSHPPYQKREQPPYSISKNQPTVKLRQEPRSLSNAQISKIDKIKTVLIAFKLTS